MARIDALIACIEASPSDGRTRQVAVGAGCLYRRRPVAAARRSGLRSLAVRAGGRLKSGMDRRFGGMRMDMSALATELGQMRVAPPDVGRACLYLPQLRAAHAFLTNTLTQLPPAGLGAAGFAFCRTALTDGKALSELAAILDEYAGWALLNRIDHLNQAGAVNPPTTLLQFYQREIFLANNPATAAADYLNNLTAFFNNYPATDHALTRLTLNFQQNLLEACTRIFLDRQTIEDMFDADHPGLTLTSLQRIKSSGSDFHKGGTQVLILTFAARSMKACVMWPMTFRLVYKPSDIEVDCLIAGDSAAINAAIPGFNLPQSLVEIFNALRLANAGAFPNAEPLRTYKVLPMQRMSAQPLGAPPFAGLRGLYGYIEYLSYETSGVSINNYYPFGSSDFLIFRTMDYQPIVTSFYRQLGQLLALACTFSLQDLHLQNVRVRNYQPVFIDLEISLTRQIADVSQTELFRHQGGIAGYQASPVWSWRTDPQTPANRPAYESLGQNQANETTQNRLLIVNPTRHVVEVEPFSLLAGLDDGLRLLNAGAAAGSFNAWWARLANALVRDLPYSTQDLTALRDSVYQSVLINQQPANTITASLGLRFNQDYPGYVPGAPPKYLVMQPGLLNADFLNLDVPIFYRRVDQLDIVESNGNAIPIPANVTIVINQVANQVPSNVGRNTYYAAAPTAIIRGDLANLPVGPTLANRINALQASVVANLQLAAAPIAPQFTFGPA
jgi:hypothetical protein